jgi:hypothetical protein
LDLRALWTRQLQLPAGARPPARSTDPLPPDSASAPWSSPSSAPGSGGHAGCTTAAMSGSCINAAAADTNRASPLDTHNRHQFSDGHAEWIYERTSYAYRFGGAHRSIRAYTHQRFVGCERVQPGSARGPRYRRYAGFPRPWTEHRPGCRARRGCWASG